MNAICTVKKGCCIQRCRYCKLNLTLQIMPKRFFPCSHTDSKITSKIIKYYWVNLIFRFNIYKVKKSRPKCWWPEGCSLVLCVNRQQGFLGGVRLVRLGHTQCKKLSTKIPCLIDQNHYNVFPPFPRSCCRHPLLNLREKTQI